MIETALIDGDIVAYRCAAVAENEDEVRACLQANEMMNRLLYETNAMGHKCFLTGDDNFRYRIYPDYKANRKDTYRPRHLQAVRASLVSEWGAVVSDGVEADDLMGIEQCLSPDGTTIIVTIDKDLLMIPGLHYTFETSGMSKKTGIRWTKPAVLQYITPLEGLRKFYGQLIMGDRADNIPGYDGLMRLKVPQFLLSSMSYLEDCGNEYEMFEHVRNMYNNDEQMLMCGQLLWIQRKENDIWNFPVEQRMDGSEA